MTTIKIGDVKNTSTWKNTKATLSIMISSEIGDVIIKECRLIEGKAGLFVAGPSRQYQTNEGETKYFQYLDLDQGVQEQVIEKAQEVFDVTREDYKMYNQFPRRNQGVDDNIPY
mgnify:FL=1